MENDHGEVKTGNQELQDFMTVAELKTMEKSNLIAALQHANWQVWGPNGAAAILGMKPSTLAYQMNAFGISKQDR